MNLKNNTGDDNHVIRTNHDNRKTAELQVKMKTTLITILSIILLISSFILGFRTYPKIRPCTEISRDTIHIYDTIEHRIPDTVPWYIVQKDTVIVNNNIPAIVDTAAILAEFYNFHYYTRDWYDITPENDTLIHINLEDVIYMNMPMDNNFSYRYYKPTTVINNVVNDVSYQSYLYAGISAPLNDYKFASGNVYFASDKLLFGVGYIPYHKSFNVTAGFKIAKFRR